MTPPKGPGGQNPRQMSSEPILAVVRRLSQLSEELRGQLGEAESEWAHEASSYDNHPADNATTVSDRELDVGLVRGLDRHLAEARRALQKWDEQSYGRCDRCGGGISVQRLEARPESVWCLGCAEHDGEVDGSADARPPEEDVIHAPYGTLYGPEPLGAGDCAADSDIAGIVEDTGSDFLQAVMQWGSSDSTEDVPPAVDAEEMFVGFREPQNTVQAVEGDIDSEGEVLWDAVRGERRRLGLSTRAQDSVLDDTPDVTASEPPDEGTKRAEP